jgi:hypothetical protein
MKRRLFNAKPARELSVQPLRPEPLIHHRCRHRRCEHPATFTAYRAGQRPRNLCRHHAVELCERNGMHLPAPL